METTEPDAKGNADHPLANCRHAIRGLHRTELPLGGDLSYFEQCVRLCQIQHFSNEWLRGLKNNITTLADLFAKTDERTNTRRVDHGHGGAIDD
ncbi:MAG: hypothetical protein AAF674_07595 [Pseudomonadota bacterium]